MLDNNAKPTFGTFRMLAISAKNSNHEQELMDACNQLKILDNATFTNKLSDLREALDQMGNVPFDMVLIEDDFAFKSEV